MSQINEYDDDDDDDDEDVLFWVTLCVYDLPLLGYSQCWWQRTDGARWELWRHRLFAVQENNET